MKQFILIAGLFLIFIGGGFYALNTYIYNEKQGDQSQNIVSYQGTLTGEYVCLPHTNTKGPQTLECALGMKTNQGEYYAVSFSPESPEQMSLRTGQKLTVTGLITPIELLSTNQWQKYPIRGIISSITSIIKL